MTPKRTAGPPWPAAEKRELLTGFAQPDLGLFRHAPERIPHIAPNPRTTQGLSWLMTRTPAVDQCQARSRGVAAKTARSTTMAARTTPAAVSTPRCARTEGWSNPIIIGNTRRRDAEGAAR